MCVFVSRAVTPISSEKVGDTVKKAIPFVLLLVCIFGLVGCSAGALRNIDRATVIEVIRYDISNGQKTDSVMVTEKSEIKHIVDNLNSLKLKKLEYNEPTVLEYELSFIDENGDRIAAVYVPANDWIDFGDGFYSIVRGELDREYISAVFGRAK